ncbi:MAG: hypothetical protein KJP00_12580 [Bacteroidia bacterium]|nr:hypothetical protein [Bacteroidia bacterium]
MRAIIISFFFLAALSCSKDNTQNEILELTGTLKEQGITTYQYGTHTLTTSDTFYALRSSVLDLDQYVDRQVTVTGRKINGYPVDGGPEFINVTFVEPE